MTGPWRSNVLCRASPLFASQFQEMRNLADLTHQAACTRPQGTRIGFQFISSIATIGFYPLWSGQSLIPKARMTVDSRFAIRRGDAKLICEGILEKTRQQYLESFNAMIVQIGQIAGSVPLATGTLSGT